MASGEAGLKGRKASASICLVGSWVMGKALAAVPVTNCIQVSIMSKIRRDPTRLTCINAASSSALLISKGGSSTCGNRGDNLDWTLSE